jgi:hypothetical protein
MNIDISRLNLSEKDIEDWLYEHPEVIKCAFGTPPITSWFGRQYSLPSGIADLIGVRADGKMVVIEVKNVAINKAAVLQVCRYASDLEEIAGYRMGYPDTQNWEKAVVERVLVGPGIDTQTFYEAIALNIGVWVFAARLSLDISKLYWDKGQEDTHRHKHGSIAEQPEWSIYGLHVREAAERHAREQAEALAVELPNDALIEMWSENGLDESDEIPL